METIRLVSTASQGHVGCSCTYTNHSAVPGRSQHLFLRTRQTGPGPSSSCEALGSLGKAALSLHGAGISAEGPCSETSSPPSAVTPAPDLHHRPSLGNTRPSPVTNTPGSAISSQHEELPTGDLPRTPQGGLPPGRATPERDGEQTHTGESCGRAASPATGPSPSTSHTENAVLV